MTGNLPASGARPRRIAFVLNSCAGGGRDGGFFGPHRAAIDAIANGGPVTMTREGDDLHAIVQRALQQGCDAVVAAGGDGTLNAVASCLVGRPEVLGVLPCGTLNHFAKDAGLPLDMAGALEVIRTGHVDTVDVGEIGGRCFLNNASLGLYVQIVRDRERQQARLGRGKWPAFAWALWSALRRMPFLRLRLEVDGREADVRTPFLFVGNNAYEIEGLHIGERRSLQQGQLSVCFATRASRWWLVQLAFDALTSRLDATRDFHCVPARELRIEAERGIVGLATDGEVTRVAAPLSCRIRPRALRVFLPEPAEATR
jgi:diacylglycerol kinase family enzyme